MKHLAFGLATGVTVFAIVVPIIHLFAAMAALVGLVSRPWDNPVEIFVFAITAAMLGTFPGGLWILLTDARRGNMFDQGHEVATYMLAAIGVFLALTILVCTRLQSVYEQFRWFLSPTLLVCGATLLAWRWKRVWRFSTKDGVRVALDDALALPGSSR